jgi:Fe-S-cluster-containing dehydrogenase component
MNAHTSAASSTEPWPQWVFEGPLLRGLDARGRRELEAAGRGFATRAGQVLYRQGSNGDSFFVVISGSVSLQPERSAPRLVRRGQTFGEEAVLHRSSRSSAAIVELDGFVLELPARVFERALGRSGGSSAVARQRRILERSAAQEALRRLSGTETLGELELAELLDASQVLEFQHGAALFDERAPASGVYLVMDGLVQLESENEGRVLVRAHLVSGDFHGAEEALSQRPYALTGTALGPCRALFVSGSALRVLAERAPGLIPALRDASRARRERQDLAKASLNDFGEAEALLDVHRLHTANALLVIEQESCVRCGHCAWACADRHGEARLLREGPVAWTALTTQAEAKLLLLPNACQHCRTPVCIGSCPTAAIVRDAASVIRIREELCTGCGACAKACPWDAIRMAPRKESTAASSADVAVKCDLCSGADAQACVQACPTEAISRVNPLEDLRFAREFFGLGALDRPAQRPRRSARLPPWPIALAVLLLSAALVLRIRAGERIFPGSGLGAWGGVLGLLLCAGAVLYVVPKRVTRARVRPWLLVHVACGALAPVAVLLHAGLRVPSNWAGALQVGFWLTLILGGFGSSSYRVLPRALSRLERTAKLPEDLAHERARLLEDLERELSGRDELVKRLAARMLVPYARAWFGPLVLVLSGRALHEERIRLAEQIDGLLQGRGKQRLTGLHGVLDLCVELRALPARRGLHFLLRAWLPLHMLLSAVLLVLLLIHVATAWRLL